MDKRDVIIACDFSSSDETVRFLERFGEERPFVKIGMELFYAEGPGIVRHLKERGHCVFLDLKLHDIPNTVKKAMRVLAGLGADIVNLHASGTKAMMEAALEGLDEGATSRGANRPLLIAVTQLTSTDQKAMEEELQIHAPIGDVVISYARNAAAAGLDGVVCSPLEASAVHAACGDRFLAVTPGVRFAGGEIGDQKRVTSPEKARELGSNYIVMGRPITASSDPLSAWLRAKNGFCPD